MAEGDEASTGAGSRQQGQVARGGEQFLAARREGIRVDRVGRVDMRYEGIQGLGDSVSPALSGDEGWNVRLNEAGRMSAPLGG